MTQFLTGGTRLPADVSRARRSRSSSPPATRRARSRRRSAPCRRSSITSSSSTTAAATRRRRSRGAPRPAARRRGDRARAQPRRRRGDRDRVRARAGARRRRDRGDGGRRADGSRRSAAACWRPWSAAQADYAKGNRFAWPGGWRTMPPVRIAGQRGAVAADAARVGLLARVRFAVRLHGGVAAGAGGDRPGANVRALRLPERSAGAARRARARASSTCRCGRCTAPSWRSGLRPTRVALPIARLLLRAFARRVRARWRGAPVMVDAARVVTPS